MMGVISFFFTKTGMRIAMIAGAILAVISVLFSARQAGRQAERVDTMKRNLESINAQRKAASRAPSDRSGVVDRLRNGKF